MKEKMTLKALIRSKLGEKSFAYQPGHWDQATAQMAVWEAEDRRKRRLIWLWMLVGLVAISFAGLGAWGLVMLDLRNNQLTNADTRISAVVEANKKRMPKHIVDEYTAELTPITPNCVPCPKKKKPIRNWIRKRKIKREERRERRQRAKLPTAYSVVADSTTLYPFKNFRLGSCLVYHNEEYPHVWRYRSAWRPRDCSPLYHPNLHLYAQSGNAFSSQTVSESGGSPVASNPQFGFGVRLAIRPGIAIETGLFHHQTELSDLRASFNAREFNFAAAQTTLNWQPQKMHWLNIPLQLHIRTLERHELYVGGSFQYLLTTRSELLQQNSDPFGPGSAESTKAWGYYQGLATWNVSLQAGYRVYLGSRLGLDLSYQHGLRNLVRDETFGADVKRFDRQLKVGLIYFIR